MYKSVSPYVISLNLVNVHSGVGSHQGNINHAQHPVNNGYSVGTHQQQQAVDGYQVQNSFTHHQPSGHGHDHAHVQHQGEFYKLIRVDEDILSVMI